MKATYSQKVWHSNDPYRKVIWRCNRRYVKGEKCGTPTLTKETVKALFFESLQPPDGRPGNHHGRLPGNGLDAGHTAALDVRIDATQIEIDEVVAPNSSHIMPYAVTGVDKEKYEQKAAEYDSRFKKAEARLAKLKVKRDERTARSRMIEGFIEEMLNAPLAFTEWQEQLWNMLVQKAVISAESSVSFIFKGEKTITVRIKGAS